MKRLNRVQDKKQISFLFPSFLKASLFFLTIVCLSLFSSGCTDVRDSGDQAEPVEAAQDVTNSSDEIGFVEVTNLSQIDEALKKGPVVLKIGSKGCIPCGKQEEVLSEVIPIYQNSASVMLIDVKEHPEFATEFGVRSIPDTSVIVDIEESKYIYMSPDGSRSQERASARFLGVTDKETLSKTLEKAIESRKAEA